MRVFLCKFDTFEDFLCELSKLLFNEANFHEKYFSKITLWNFWGHIDSMSYKLAKIMLSRSE